MISSPNYNKAINLNEFSSDLDKQYMVDQSAGTESYVILGYVILGCGLIFQTSCQ